jgi:hypothetical protein
MTITATFYKVEKGRCEVALYDDVSNKHTRWESGTWEQALASLINFCTDASIPRVNVTFPFNMKKFDRMTDNHHHALFGTVTQRVYVERHVNLAPVAWSPSGYW